MKNSTLNGIPTPVPRQILNDFLNLDEYGALGQDPRTHKSWKDFTYGLKARYGDSIAGIIIFSYKENGHTSFCFMLYPVGSINKGDGLIPDNKFQELIEVFKIHKGRTLEEFVRI